VLRIGDFSQLAEISVRTLRLYDEMGLLKPARIDPFTDYRYYEVEQLPRLNRILALKDLGFTLDEVKHMIDAAPSVAQLQTMLDQRRDALEAQIRDDELRLQRVTARLRQIASEGSPPQFDIRIKDVEALTLVGIRHTVVHLADMPNVRGRYLDELYAGLKRALPPRHEPGVEVTLYHNTEYSDEGIDTEQAVIVSPKSVPALSGTLPAPLALTVLPAAQAAVTVFHGPFPDVVHGVRALYAWIGTNGYATCGAVREIHVFGREIDLTLENFTVTVELQLPVERS
jgi:DNA-binding transcriptional MerR regulator